MLKLKLSAFSESDFVADFSATKNIKITNYR